MQTQEDRPNHMRSGYSKELNVQNVSYLMGQLEGESGATWSERVGVLRISEK